MLRKVIFLVFIIFLGSIVLYLSYDNGVIKKRRIRTDEIATLKPLPEGHKLFILNIYPKIATANLEIEIKRENIKKLKSKYKKVIIKGERLHWLKEIAAEYKFEDSLFNRELTEEDYKFKIDTLLSRVDIIPEHLVLAQAIVESGWGKSKFAKVANNYFGIRCYTPGCGVQPEGNPDSTFWVKKYPTIELCMEEYLRTLNTGQAYVNLRRARVSLREAYDFPNGTALAQLLKKYSESGNQYINLITSIIENYIPENLAAYVKYQGSTKMLEEEIFTDEKEWRVESLE